MLSSRIPGVASKRLLQLARQQQGNAVVGAAVRSRLRASSYSTQSRSTRRNGTRLVTGAAAVATVLLVSQLYQIENESAQQQPLLPGAPTKSISPSEVAKHNTPDDCWVVIEGYVYNLTEFIPTHPGGPMVIKSNAGKDVTAIFKPLHAKGTIEKFVKKEWFIGPLSEPMPAELVCPEYTPGETREEIVLKERLRESLPPLANIVNLYDFEKLASKILSNQAWAYYSSGSDDEISLRENHNAYHRIFFKPKVLVDVSKVDTRTKMLGSQTDVPFYVTATALMKLGNPQGGEMDIAKGCGATDVRVPQMISTLASCSIDEIADAKVHDDQIQWYQLYVNSDRKVTKELIQHVEALGLKALFVTVDAPSLGHREKDLKIKFSTMQSGPELMQSKPEHKDAGAEKGASRALSKFIDPALSWNDIVEFKKHTKLPIVIKGVQRAEDVVKAAELGLAGVVISNHGGRQLDFSRSPVEVLAESVPELEKRGLRSDNFQLFIDGGVRRGTDILKALCLGANGVGLGRPFIYANSCYGKEGVAKAISLLTDELEMSMRLLGVTSIDQLGPELLDLSALRNRNVSVAHDNLYNSVYKSPTLAQFIDEDGDLDDI
ncbi:FMN-dependent alpha-hydroxy acid dehydrogenase KNAG_0E03860 [Huiozyma naganishii CBS 8797]|uniref:L-lactate dehydrogenase (cytochrome) n=1 Tax=Huiozyma naganishii (strain ATCC MYA-139 / BCRC 22969 / CBS 8797 / KCTC 17520 / NBRC 10181 / NCYC 3082 / Yp74L-3) TaxID=1071383 RepID=J7R703_HUIN7|nr:hypothetical protein KNAG_0E03860 [Kazachstania naganishii CBS 8797]CCK70640.1 hypothetical protein KNAG_0E03860 [Kazachstania naganishii CBS 8797]